MTTTVIGLAACCLVGGAALVMTAPPAAAFDNAQCGPYFVGGWASKGTRDFGGKSGAFESHSMLKADGTYHQTTTLTVEGEEPSVEQSDGTWQAKPGPEAGTCAYSAMSSAGRPKELVLTVIDDNTLKTAGGITETRE